VKTPAQELAEFLQDYRVKAAQRSQEPPVEPPPTPAPVQSKRRKRMAERLRRLFF
jgi:hypothetical protein